MVIRPISIRSKQQQPPAITSQPKQPLPQSNKTIKFQKNQKKINMGGPQTTRNAWRGSAEYQVWANIDRPSLDPRYKNAYQLWRNKYIATNNVVCAPKKLYIKKRKVQKKVVAPKQNHANSVQCGCGGWVQPTKNMPRHRRSIRHIRWEEDKQIKIQKKEREVVCKFLW